MQEIPLHTEKDMLLRVAAGDEAAFRELFDQYWDNIYGVALAFTKSAAIAEDIVQEVFIKVWQKRDRLAALDRFDNWLFIIARNHILNTLRQRSREIPFTEGLTEYFKTTADSPEQRLLFRESAELVRQAVERLPPQQQKIWRLSREEGLSQEEIAAELQIAKNTVKSHMGKALIAVRDYLRDHADEALFLACILRALL